MPQSTVCVSVLVAVSGWSSYQLSDVLIPKSLLISLWRYVATSLYLSINFAFALCQCWCLLHDMLVINFSSTINFIDDYISLTISSLESLREERNVVWHCRNLIEGSCKAWPKILWEGTIELIVAERGRSSHWWTCFVTTLSKFLVIHVLPKFTSNTCQESFERT